MRTNQIKQIAIWGIIRVGLGVLLAFLLLAMALMTLSGLPLTSFAPRLSQIAPVKAAGPLPNGVAAGDTTPTSAVLWTRGTIMGSVLFEYTTDPAFNTGILTAMATITNLLQPVKVAINGLSPATTYFYRATDTSGASANGHFHTPTLSAAYTGLRFGVSGDGGGHLAPFPSIANADDRNLDFFVALGDTAYTDVPSPVLAPPATTLAEFRLKHNEVYSLHLGLNTWADLRASTSILAMIDDHEVRNDFAGGAAPSSDPRFDNTGDFINETQLYGNGLQAFQEFNPVRDEFYGATGDPRTLNKRKLYRYRTYGRDAAVFLLDTRSFRDEPLPLDPTNLASIANFLSNSLNDTGRTMLGAQQLNDLKADLLQAQADNITWKFIVVSGPIQNLGIFAAPDRWEGYAAERSNLLQFINQNGIKNVVFITASLHGTIVNNLTYQTIPFGPQIPTPAFEVIAGPVAINPPFGPATVALAQSYNIITPGQVSTYNSLSRAGKDEFVRQLVDEELLAPLGYDLIGLNGSGINAALLQGGYVAAHTYGWTEFEINQATQVLTVTTYGIDFYTEAELAANPNNIITRTPGIVSQFIVTPTVSLNAVAITGPTTGLTQTTYTFTATVSPPAATTPITYTWQATDQTPVTHSHTLSTTINFTWTISGLKTITVTADNGAAPVTNSHTISINEPDRTWLPVILKSY